MCLVDSAIPGESLINKCLLFLRQELRSARVWKVDKIKVRNDTKHSGDGAFDNVNPAPSFVCRMVAYLNQAVGENVGKPLDKQRAQEVDCQSFLNLILSIPCGHQEDGSRSVSAVVRRLHAPREILTLPQRRPAGFSEQRLPPSCSRSLCLS